MDKPAHIFDREFEWEHLARFAARAGTQAQLGVITGRRRQGKTYLLEAVAAKSGGLYFGATQATATESLTLFAAALSSHLRSTVPLHFASWDEAVRFLYTAPQLQAAVVVIDEFPYLSKVEPALPSIVQREADRAATRGSGPSVLLCGSALSVMGQLLAGDAPLRGRANLEQRGLDTRAVRLTCYSAAGFDHDLEAAAAGDHRIQLVGLADLYSTEGEV